MTPMIERRSPVSDTDRRTLPTLTSFQTNVVFVVGIIFLLSNVGLFVYERAFTDEVLDKKDLIAHGVWAAVGLALAVPRRTLQFAEWILTRLPFFKPN